ncbi:MAG: hypothetical protein IJN90_06320 [Bacilli bacterium]|nr:hypothetical protein [Bacilli bacterium]
MITIYNIKKNIDKIKRGDYTYFLDQKEANQVKSKLKKNEYKIFETYPECNKIILYTSNIPNIKTYEIKSKIKLRHQDILGSLFSLNITNEMFGDIIVNEDKYYIFILDVIDKYIKSNLLFIKNAEIELIEKDINEVNNYKQKYEEYNIIVSSLRIDTIIAHIINTNRNNVIDKIKNKEIILNYEILNKNSYILKENDIFSIRKFGKYKFIGVEKTTKKDNLIIKYLKYI